MKWYPRFVRFVYTSSWCLLEKGKTSRRFSIVTGGAGWDCSEQVYDGEYTHTTGMWKLAVRLPGWLLAVDRTPEACWKRTLRNWHDVTLTNLRARVQYKGTLSRLLWCIFHKRRPAGDPDELALLIMTVIKLNNRYGSCWFVSVDDCHSNGLCWRRLLKIITSQLNPINVRQTMMGKCRRYIYKYIYISRKCVHRYYLTWQLVIWNCVLRVDLRDKMINYKVWFRSISRDSARFFWNKVTRPRNLYISENYTYLHM